MEITKIINNYLVCEELNANSETDSGFSFNTEARVKVVRVLKSAEEDVPEGCLVKIIASAGLVDGEELIIRRSDIIYIV